MKPPYRVPSMAEIEALEPNGFTAASTFSGCGGSCLGHRIAGFRVAWASEFVPAAAETYRLNHPDTHLDTRDIRQVSARDILGALGMKRGELDLLDGSPPCASFSTAGKRDKGWGKVKSYSDTQQRTDDLFFEYARLLEGLQPRAFVAENVPGLVRGTAKGYFKVIMGRLRECGYKVRAQVLDASWLGVPQARQRLIFIGIRNDLGRDPVFPKPLPHQYTLRDALPWIAGFAHRGHGYTPKGEWSADRPAPTVVASPNGAMYYGHEVEVVSGDGGLQLPPSRARAYDGEPAFNFTICSADKPAPTVTCASPGNDMGHPTERRKFSIAELRRICGFPDDFKLTGSYSQQWERLGRAVPPVMMAHVAAEVREVLRSCAA